MKPATIEVYRPIKVWIIRRNDGEVYCNDQGAPLLWKYRRDAQKAVGWDEVPIAMALVSYDKRHE